MRENTEVPNRPAHLYSVVWIVAARLVSDCHYWDELIRMKVYLSHLQMGLGLPCLHVSL